MPDCPTKGWWFDQLNKCIVAAPDNDEIIESDQPPNWSDYNSSISNILDQESAAIGNRMQWSLTIQGFLFASHALSDSWKDSHALAVGGILVAFVSLIGALAAYSNINRIKREWYNHSAEKLENSPLGKTIVQPFADPCPSLWGRVPALGTPFVVTWIWVKMLL